jgi:D-alanyl-D-alanine-carboxypeptidase/D-alanyl-D-alanine-endopeptidase
LSKLRRLTTILALAAATILYAQKAPPIQTADALGAELFAATASTGMVLVVVRDNDVFVQGYGETAPGSGQRPDANSLLRLCSVSKTLTTDLLVKLAKDHLIALTDPLQKFAPEGKTVPTFAGNEYRPITIGDLATHTAGLPRETGPTPRNVSYFAFPDQEYRWNWLPKQHLLTLPGTAASYSNIGFALLGDALEQASGKTYAQLFHDRAAQPLGLRDTTLSPTPDQCARFLTGAHRESACIDTQATAGSGGMYSTAADMTLWLKYLLNLPGVPVHQDPAAQAIYLLPAQLTALKGLQHAGDPTGLGLAWVRIGQPPDNPTDPGMILQKTGGGGGFSTYVAISQAHHIGLFLAATDGPKYTNVHLFRQANNLLLVMAGLPPLPPEPERPEPEPTPARARARTTAHPATRAAARAKTRPAAKRRPVRKPSPKPPPQ